MPFPLVAVFAKAAVFAVIGGLAAWSAANEVLPETSADRANGFPEYESTTSEQS